MPLRLPSVASAELAFAACRRARGRLRACRAAAALPLRSPRAAPAPLRSSLPPAPVAPTAFVSRRSCGSCRAHSSDNSLSRAPLLRALLLVLLALLLMISPGLLLY